MDMNMNMELRPTVDKVFYESGRSAMLELFKMLTDGMDVDYNKLNSMSDRELGKLFVYGAVGMTMLAKNTDIFEIEDNN